MVNYIISTRNNRLTKSGDFRILPIDSDGEVAECYLVNYNEGWELISANRRHPMVLMECASGSLNSENDIFFNPAEELFLRNQMKRISSDIVNGEELINVEYSDLHKENIGIPCDLDISDIPEFESVIMNDTTVVTSINHMTYTAWGQSHPWNQRAPYKNAAMTNHGATGCTMVALAQYLYFLYSEYDSEFSFYSDFYSDAIMPAAATSYLTLTPSNVHFTETSYGDYFSELPLSSSGMNADKVSSLMVYLGYLFEAKYRQNGTGASLFKAQEVMGTHFGLTLSMTEDKASYSDLIDFIAYHAYPLIAQLTNNNGEGGHVVLIDAVKNSVRTYDVYRKRYRYNRPGEAFEIVYEYMHTVTETTRQIGANWGWNGVGNSVNGEPVWYNIDGELKNPYYSNTYDTIKRILY
ncbi:MAG: C10 family peptidase [Bacteroidales bacterium]|nr:C10 family peptidase [Bacteroidales bacterium]